MSFFIGTPMSARQRRLGRHVVNIAYVLLLFVPLLIELMIVMTMKMAG